MKKIVLIDGNNFMFRSYYATAYSGSILRNSKGFPTNALYGFVSMINKIIEEEKPSYMAVAFDIGKNFRKQEFSFYKEGRQQTPEELKMQMPIARKILDAMGIRYLELEPYEADDIIGTLVKMIEIDKDFDATIISSDKDLLQLINYETDYKLLKQSGYIRYTEKSFKEEYKLDPIKIIDLKALMGDSSDNIPGVKGIGEKTALKLLQEYQSLDGIYENIDNIKGATHDKLVSGKEDAYMSYKIATIYKDVPLNINLEDLKYSGEDINKLNDIYNELEFKSLIKAKNNINEDIKYIGVNKDINIVLSNKIALYIECDSDVYNKGNILGACITDGKYTYFFDKENLYRLKEILPNKEIITFDHKKNLYLLDYDFIVQDDLLISSFLAEINNKDDISYLCDYYGVNIPKFNDIKKLDYEDVKKIIVQKTMFIYKHNDQILEKIISDNQENIYRDIELPLLYVLSSMEKEGVKVSKDVLINEGLEIDKKLNEVKENIYKLAGCEFNISSVKQLGEVLFEKLNIDKGKKNKIGYKTDEKTLEKLKDENPIVNQILSYRALSKLKSTYIDGLINYIDDNSLVHSIFTQTIARTGRLSSIEPNLQNIPVRDEIGRKVRKAFIPKNDLFLSSDYSQVELRILSHITNCKAMIDTFNSDGDIHTKVASDIYGKKEIDVTSEERKKAKSVIFGIVYGISGFGLGENLNISRYEAQNFINKYYELYPEVKEYMTSVIENAKKNGYVNTLFGRKRFIKEINDSNFMIRQTGERMAINTPIQGTAADIMKMAMINVYNRFKKEKIESKIVIQVHDELIIDVKKEELGIVQKILKEEMENVYKLNVPLKVSSDVGCDWYETK